jgi:hypothetical protein
MDRQQSRTYDEPDSHTLRLLREFREELREFRNDTHRNFGEVNERIDGLARMIAGESILRE